MSDLLEYDKVAVAGCGPPGRPALARTVLQRQGFQMTQEAAAASYEAGDQVLTSCPAHLSLLGAATRTCGEDGAWTPALPSCGEWILCVLRLLKYIFRYIYLHSTAATCLTHHRTTQHTINSHKNISYPIVMTIMTSTSTRRLHGLAGGGVLLVTLLQGDHLDQSEVSTRSRDPPPPTTAHLLAHHAEHDAVQRPAPLLLLLDVLPPPGRGHHGLQRRAVLPGAGVLRCGQWSVFSVAGEC